MGASKPFRIAFLCSGGGGNLRFLAQAVARGWLPGAELCAVLADRPCPAIGYAASAGLPHRVLDFSGAGQQAVVEALEEARPDLVITTVHRILQPPVVAALRGKLVNLHYSLLPAFGGSIGTKPVRAAIDYGALFTGATAHEVDDTLDGGRPWVQAAVPIRPDEDLDELMNVVFRCGCLALLAAVKLRLDATPAPPARTITVLGRPCLFSAGSEAAETAANDASLWAQVAAA